MVAHNEPSPQGQQQQQQQQACGDEWAEQAHALVPDDGAYLLVQLPDDVAMMLDRGEIVHDLRPQAFYCEPGSDELWRFDTVDDARQHLYAIGLGGTLHILRLADEQGGAA